MRPWGTALVLLSSFGSGLAASAGRSGDGAPVLDVPYLPQTEALCGGAAAAMVLRYWGARDVQGEDFRNLVEEELGGIRTSALREAIERRGWRAHAFRGSEADVRNHLARGRPLILLIEDRPGRYHYVVAVGWKDERVVVHDPARAPHVLLGPDELERAWRPAEFWTLLVLPGGASERGSEGGEAAEAPIPAPPAPGSCDDLVRSAVRLARQREDHRSESLLGTAARLCPESAAPVRELAGLRFVQKRWSESVRLAERALDLDPGDAYGWRLLGAGLFLAGDAEGSLRAWNRVGEPRIDRVQVEGLRRTRHPVLAGRLGLSPRELLTDARLRRARRRLAAFPTARRSRLSYRPLPDGRAQVDAALVERPLVPLHLFDVAGTALHAGVDRELRVAIASPSGAGESAELGWRWWEERPRAFFSLAFPSRRVLPGSWRIEAYRERQAYGYGDALARESRRGSRVEVSDWSLSGVRWALAGGVDRWEGRGAHLVWGGSIEKRTNGDRFAVASDLRLWSPLSGGSPFAAAGASGHFRSAPESDRRSLRLRAGIEAASARAPVDLWPGAGVGHARVPLLRAHPLLDGGVVRGEAFGRVLVHGGIEMSDWLVTTAPARFGFAVFAEGGKPWKTLSSSPVPALLDVGAGLRVSFLFERSILRIDAARGLVDGAFALSMGWQLPWPSRSRSAW